MKRDIGSRAFQVNQVLIAEYHRVPQTEPINIVTSRRDTSGKGGAESKTHETDLRHGGGVL